MAYPSEEEISKMTPMMRQFYDLKSSVPDAIMLFRMGDFYEIFGDDALEVAPKLELVLTSRERGEGHKIPFCGVPHHSAKNYWLKLLRLGYRVAIADQMEAPDQAKGIVKREITQILTPGCIDELEGLDADQPNYMMTVYEHPGVGDYAVVIVDTSTGEFRAGQVKSLAAFKEIVTRLRPKEILARRFIHDELRELLGAYIQQEQLLFASISEGLIRDQREQKKLLNLVFGVDRIDSFLCGKITGGLEAVTATLAYFRTLNATMSHFLSIKPLQDADTMYLGETAMRDLELFETVRRRQLEGSLFKEINRTATPMGARLLRANLAAPFVQVEHIAFRQSRVKFLLDRPELLDQLRAELKACPDIQRLATRVLNKKSPPGELAFLRDTLKRAVAINDRLAQCADKQKLNDFFGAVCDALKMAVQPMKYLETAISQDPGPLANRLDVIAEGFDLDFDAQRQLSRNGDLAISSYEEDLRQKTGINSLKIKQHKSLGLLIEVTKTNLSKVPSDFVRRQTMVNNERFVTEKLLDLDEQLSQATDLAMEKEQALYLSVLENLAQYKVVFYDIAAAIADLDLVQGLSTKANEGRYERPKLSKDGALILDGARHPVVERFVGRNDFIPNNIHMGKDARHLLITGPNMAGKSTVMRQTAIVAILHQIGSYVPCVSAQMPIFDRIFTRVGAADDLSKGQSTFMVEMSEVAQILREASPRSLVILDEVGRGTSSQDGLAIASAILENLSQSVNCYSLFATHYHELASLADCLASVKNVQSEVKEESGSVKFTHRLIEGASGSSYGIEVAKLAGIPKMVIDRAKDFINEPVVAVSVDHKLPQGLNEVKPPKASNAKKQLAKNPAPKPLPIENLGLETVGEKQQVSERGALQRLSERIAKVNLNKTTPLQALNILDELMAIMDTAQESPELFQDLTH